MAALVISGCRPSYRWRVIVELRTVCVDLGPIEVTVALVSRGAGNVLGCAVSIRVDRQEAVTIIDATYGVRRKLGRGYAEGLARTEAIDSADHDLPRKHHRAAHYQCTAAIDAGRSPVIVQVVVVDRCAVRVVIIRRRQSVRRRIHIAMAVALAEFDVQAFVFAGP